MTAPYTAADLAAVSARAEAAQSSSRESAALSAIRASADDVPRLVAELTRTREALRPFAKEAERYEPDEGDGEQFAWDSMIKIGDFRRARAALGEEPADGDTER